ncbi:MAG: tetratricopeptide repeat protein, partial [Bacteroidales bacterium]|nr:tetratricopeptide repeat protein [Bacteroidales bacterium]
IQLITVLDDSIILYEEVNLHGRMGVKTIEEYDKNIIISGGWDNNIVIYNLQSGVVLKTLKQHTNDVNVVKLSPDKKTLVSGGADKKIIVWDIDSSFKVNNSQVLNEYPQNMIKAIEFIDNSSFIAGDKSGNIKFIEIIRGRPVVKESFNFTSEVIDIKIYKDKAYVACRDGIVHVFDITNNSKTSELHFTGIINDIEISNFPTNDNFLFVALERQYKIKIVNLDDNTLSYPDIRTANNVISLAFLANKKLLALSESGSIIISMDYTEPTTNRFSAYYYYNYFISKNVLSFYNQDKMKFLLVAGMMSYVDEIIYSFIVGKFIYPSIEEINQSLFLVDYGLSLYSNYEVISKKLNTQRLLLEIYKNILYGTTADLENAIALIDSVRIIEPYAVYPLTQLAQVHTELNNLSLAEQNIVLAAQSLPTWTETMARKGRIYQKQGLFDQAEIEYRKIISERPDLSKGYIYLSQLYMQTNNVDSAWKYIKLAQDKEDKNEFILNQRALIAIQSLDIDDARTSLRTAKTLSPTYKISLINEGKYFEITGDLLQAENNYNKLFAADSAIAEPFYLLANLYSKVGDLKKAEELLNIGINRFSDNTEIILAMADLNAFKFFNIQADYIWGSKALKLYNHAIDMDPYNYKTYAKKANFYEKLYEHRKKNLIPNNVLISHIDTLSSKLFLDTIYSNLKLAAMLSPQNLELLIELSDYFYKTNNIDSLNEIKKYLNGIENNYQNLFYLGRFYSVTNQDKKAYKYFQKLIKTHPNFDPVFFQMLKLDLIASTYSNIIKNRDKYQHLKESEFFVYYYETIVNLTNTNKAFTKKYSKYYLREIARNNLKYLKRQLPELIVEENWGYSRADIIENKWIIIKRNGKSGVMLFNGTILIPANFDSVLYLTDNLFECKAGSKTFTFEVNLLTANLKQ